MSFPAGAPFQHCNQLIDDLDQTQSHGSPFLPGYPSLSLANDLELYDFLNQEFISKLLDDIAPKLWWMSKQDSGNISPLHRQLVKRRNIIITEDPKLHLVWHHDRIFIKPLPRYLASYTFWVTHFEPKDEKGKMHAHVYKAALGYLRTFTHLIRYQSDFVIAMDPKLRLLPEGTTWKSFCDFSADISARVTDVDVSERWAYGEVRLTRLNMYTPFITGNSHFQRVEYQYSEYFARFYAPMLFAIGISTILLGGLQVAVAAAAELMPGQSSSSLEFQEDRMRQAIVEASLWFSIVMFLLFSIIAIGIILMLIYKVLKEWRYAIHDRIRLGGNGRFRQGASSP